MVRRVRYAMTALWLCQLPSRLCFYIRTRRLVRVIVLVFLVVAYCEFVHYYVVLLCCFWPVLGRGAAVSSPIYSRPLRVMLIGDTHVLGAGAHWFDKLRREWQMTRSFQASMLIHSPDVVFILGDLLDEGKESSKEEFEKDSERFKKLFRTPLGVRTEIVVGNHDIGFHYMMNDRKHDRFVNKFDAPSVQLLHIRGVIFVLINSIAMEGDSCNICQDTVDKLNDVKWKLKCSKGVSEQRYLAKVCETIEPIAYTKPILLQECGSHSGSRLARNAISPISPVTATNDLLLNHFPLYRDSDENCSTPDAASAEEKDVPFRERFDCLSKDSTDMLFEMLDPRLVITAHTHHGCYRVHENGVPEYTVASYNWRNKKSPTFLLAEVSGDDFVVKRCYLPDERTVISIYISGAFLLVLCICLPTSGRKVAGNKELIFVNKSH